MHSSEKPENTTFPKNRCSSPERRDKLDDLFKILVFLAERGKAKSFVKEILKIVRVRLSDWKVSKRAFVKCVALFAMLDHFAR